MSVFLYTGGLGLVRKSGVGQAILHQEALLEQAGIPTVERWRTPSQVIHINTVFPRSVLAALRARLTGKKVVYYGHSTMEDFRCSFRGSNLLAPLFRRWILFCYSLGDVVLTPTEYSKALLKSYGLRRPIHSISNGIDTAFFAPSAARGRAFRTRYGLGRDEKVVVSVGHTIQRKGILDFIQLARWMPEVRFLWFGYTNPELLPRAVREAMEDTPENLSFPGFLEREALRDAYCGTDAFVFLSHEETEGIVVLEALACGVPTVLRDIPVYDGWLEQGRDVYKVRDLEEAVVTVSGLLQKTLPDLTAAGRAAAERRSFRAVAERLRAIYRREGLLELAETPAISSRRPPLPHAAKIGQ